MDHPPDVLVVGGGVIGLTCACFLAREGLTVEVLDRGELGSEASWAGAGIIPPGDPERAASPFDRLRAVSSRMYPAFSGELRERVGIDNGYRVCGGVEFLTAEDLDAPRAWAAEGIAHEPLDASALGSLEPEARAVNGTAYYLPGLAQVRNPRHLRALVAVCQQAGVRLHPNTSVAGWERQGDRITAARLADGSSRPAGQFLIAAGAWGDQLLHPLGLRPGVHPVRGQIVLFRTPRPLFRTILLYGRNYLVPRDDGHVLAGATQEPEAGFDKRTTGGGVDEVLGTAFALVPALKDAEFVRAWAGLRPGTPDGMPFLGPVPGWRNAFVATGHFRAGIQLSTGTALVMTERLTGKPTSVPLDAFRADREPNPAFAPAFRS